MNVSVKRAREGFVDLNYNEVLVLVRTYMHGKSFTHQTGLIIRNRRRYKRDRKWDLCSPHILSNALDPVTQLVDTSIPILQTVPHALDLLHIQNLRLHPVYLGDLSHLINGTLEQTQRERLHDQMLDLLGLDLRFGGDGRESQVAVVRGPTEDHLRQRGQGDLLVQENAVLLEQLVLGDVSGEDVVGGQVAAVEGEQELAQPAVRRLGEGVQDRVQEEFTEVVDGVGDERGHAEVVCAGDALGFTEILEVDAGEVEEGVLVEGGEFLFGLWMWVEGLVRSRWRVRGEYTW